MTIGLKNPLIRYVYSQPDTFSFQFRILKDTDLVVTHFDSNGIETVLTLDTNYTVTTQPTIDGGTITVVTQYELGELEIKREVPCDQTTNYVNNNPFDMEILERSLDKLTMLVQQHCAEFLTIEDKLDELVIQPKLVPTTWGLLTFYFDALHAGGTPLPTYDVYANSFPDVWYGYNLTEVFLNGVRLIEEIDPLTLVGDYTVDYENMNVTILEDVPEGATVVVKIGFYSTGQGAIPVHHTHTMSEIDDATWETVEAFNTKLADKAETI